MLDKQGGLGYCQMTREESGCKWSWAMATGGGRRFEAARHPTLHPLKNRAVSGFSVRRWRSSRLFFLTVF